MAAHWSSRLGARRGAMPPHRASRARLPEGQCAPPNAANFCPLASLRSVSDAGASKCEARLASGPNLGGEMGSYYRDLVLSGAAV